MQYRLKPVAMPAQCKGCGRPSTVEHVLICKVKGIIGNRHNDIKWKWNGLCTDALGTQKLNSQDVRVAGQNSTALEDDLRGDRATNRFWRLGITTIFNICVTDPKALYQRG